MVPKSATYFGYVEASLAAAIEYPEILETQQHKTATKQAENSCPCTICLLSIVKYQMASQQKLRPASGRTLRVAHLAWYGSS